MSRAWLSSPKKTLVSESTTLPFVSLYHCNTVSKFSDSLFPLTCTPPQPILHTDSADESKMQIWFFVKYLIDLLCYRINSKLCSMVYAQSCLWICPLLGGTFCLAGDLAPYDRVQLSWSWETSLLKTFSHTDIGWTLKKAPPPHPSSQSLHLMASGGFLWATFLPHRPLGPPRLQPRPAVWADRGKSRAVVAQKRKIRKEESVKHAHRIMGFMNT